MYKLSALSLSLLTLAACTTSSLTEEEQAPVTPTDDRFSLTSVEIDKSQSVISFFAKSNIINHEGKFNEYTATIDLDDANPSAFENATLQITFDMDQIEVDAPGLEGHLKREDFFDVENYPTATFVSKEITPVGDDNNYDVVGDLTIKGVTKEVVVNVEVTNDYLVAQWEFPRADFGVGNDSYGEKLLDPMVDMNVKLVFMK